MHIHIEYTHFTPKHELETHDKKCQLSTPECLPCYDFSLADNCFCDLKYYHCLIKYWKEYYLFIWVCSDAMYSETHVQAVCLEENIQIITFSWEIKFCIRFIYIKLIDIDTHFYIVYKTSKTKICVCRDLFSGLRT